MAIRHRRGCRAKTHRSLDHGAASKTAQALNAQCARQGKTCEEVEPHRNTRQCVHGASRNTKVTHTIVHCNEWGVSTPRDAGASGNAVLKTIARGARVQPGRGVPAGRGGDRKTSPCPQPGGDGPQRIRPAPAVPVGPEKAWPRGTSPCELRTSGDWEAADPAPEVRSEVAARQTWEKKLTRAEQRDGDRAPRPGPRACGTRGTAKA